MKDMGVCEVILSVLYILNLGLYLEAHGKPKEGKYNFWECLIVTSVVFFLLWKGGFYS